MRISGFSYACNADLLYYPVKESILSVLPVCDEFVMAVGKGAVGDRTREIIESIGDPKIRIIDTVWELKEGAINHVFRQQANLAMQACSGDWCFHIQCDEVVHEDDLPEIRRRCEDLAADRRVEGMLLQWLHFWGDYSHIQRNHRWFTREIRIVRNGIGVESYKDSQSFRRDGEKLNVVELQARVFHYAYVRPPRLLRKKQVVADAIYRNRQPDNGIDASGLAPWDYGSLERVPVFSGSHPAVMREWMAKMDWRDQLQYCGKSRVKFRHDHWRYRLVSWIERTFLGGRHIGGFNNYRILKGV